MIILDERHRARALRVASQITSNRRVATAVAINASPLLAWLEASEDQDDLRLRWQAMRQHYLNIFDQRGDDDPERFLGGAQVLYAFLTAGQRS
jgi:hypothetical protein